MSVKIVSDKGKKISFDGIPTGMLCIIQFLLFVTDSAIMVFGLVDSLEFSYNNPERYVECGILFFIKAMVAVASLAANFVYIEDLDSKDRKGLAKSIKVMLSSLVAISLSNVLEYLVLSKGI